MWGLERMFRLGWRWVVLLTALVVLPAIALTLLSIRAFQGEASRAAYQRRERQQQVLRLLDNDLGDWVRSLQREKPAPGPAGGFDVRDSGVFFPLLNVHLPPGHDRPAEIRLSGREAALWRRARASEQRNASSGAAGVAAYRELLGHGPPLAPLARLALLRLALQRRDCPRADAWLAAIRGNDQAATTESGIPIWIASALLLQDAGGACRSQTATQLLADSLTELQCGRWALTAAQWTYYARELLAAVEPELPPFAGIPATAGFLESFELSLPEVLALHQNRQWRQSYPFAARHMPALQAVVVLVPEGDAEAGLIVPAGRFRGEATRKLEVLTSAEDFEGRIALLDGPAESAAAVLPAFPFLQAHFVEKSQSPWRAHVRRYLVFYMTAVLLLITGAGLALVYRAVAREVEVSRMKAEFVASVSHEFRTPLAAIDALLERLESGRARDEDMRQRYYRASRREVHRLTRMVNQLLSLARLEQGREQFAREPFDLNEPAAEAVQSFVDLGFGARLEASLDTEQDHRVLADRTATYQCVHNLVDNALKYSPKDARVTIRTGRSSGMAFVEVQDLGPGIPAAEQPLVFEQFYRGAGARSNGIQGAGIGLAYVKKVVEAHGGRATLESRPGAGSTFRLWFPAVPSTAQPDEARDRTP